MWNVFSLVSAFLPREMHHVYRQVSNLSNYKSVVLARKRLNEALFPHNNVKLIKKSPFRFLRRAYYRARRSSVPLSCNEISQVLKLRESLGDSVLHIYQGDVALRSLPLLNAFPGPRVVSFHGADLSNRFGVEDYSRLWDKAEVFLCRCKSLKGDLVNLGFPLERIRLNYTGVPLPSVSKNLASFDSRNERTFRILQVSRFIEKKGMDITLMALRCFLDEGLNAKLHLVGDGPLLQNLIELTEKLGLGRNVEFCGFLDGPQLEAEYLNADVFCHPSREADSGDREGIPNSIIEALSYGLPVVSTRHSGIPELISNRENGILVDEVSPKSICHELVKLASDSEACRFLSVNARALVEKKFSISRCIDDLESSYKLAISMAGSN
jgi:colanic acid/amylovoran biosynthesis glycosyltransferase